MPYTTLMYNLNDGASGAFFSFVFLKISFYFIPTEAPLYLVPNSEGTGKRLVRRPHPPPTSAPLPDDFDAITTSRDNTTIYDDATNSALSIDYDAMTLAATATHERPLPIHAPIPLSPTRSQMSPRRQRRAASPSHSFAGPDLRSAGNGDGPVPHDKGLGYGKARSVAGDRSARRSLGSGSHPPAAVMPLPPFPLGKGPAAGRNDLVEKKVLEDGPQRTISVWREGVAKDASEAGDGEGDGGSDLDSHVGRRRRLESVTQTAGSVKSKGHRSKASADFSEASVPETFSKIRGAESITVSLNFLESGHVSAAQPYGQVLDTDTTRQRCAHQYHPPAVDATKTKAPGAGFALCRS